MWNDEKSNVRLPGNYLHEDIFVSNPAYSGIGEHSDFMSTYPHYQVYQDGFSEDYSNVNSTYPHYQTFQDWASRDYEPRTVDYQDIINTNIDELANRLKAAKDSGADDSALANLYRNSLLHIFDYERNLFEPFRDYEEEALKLHQQRANEILGNKYPFVKDIYANLFHNSSGNELAAIEGEYVTDATDLMFNAMLRDLINQRTEPNFLLPAHQQQFESDFQPLIDELSRLQENPRKKISDMLEQLWVHRGDRKDWSREAKEKYQKAWEKGSNLDLLFKGQSPLNWEERLERLYDRSPEKWSDNWADWYNEEDKSWNPEVAKRMSDIEDALKSNVGDTWRHQLFSMVSNDIKNRLIRAVPDKDQQPQVEPEEFFDPAFFTNMGISGDANVIIPVAHTLDNIERRLGQESDKINKDNSGWWRYFTPNAAFWNDIDFLGEVIFNYEDTKSFSNAVAQAKKLYGEQWRDKLRDTINSEARGKLNVFMQNDLADILLIYADQMDDNALQGFFEDKASIKDLPVRWQSDYSKFTKHKEQKQKDYEVTENLLSEIENDINLDTHPDIEEAAEELESDMLNEVRTKKLSGDLEAKKENFFRAINELVTGSEQPVEIQTEKIVTSLSDIYEETCQENISQIIENPDAEEDEGAIFENIVSSIGSIAGTVNSFFGFAAARLADSYTTHAEIEARASEWRDKYVRHVLEQDKYERELMKNITLTIAGFVKDRLADLASFTYQNIAPIVLQSGIYALKTTAEYAAQGISEAYPVVKDAAASGYDLIQKGIKERDETRRKHATKLKEEKDEKVRAQKIAESLKEAQEKIEKAMNKVTTEEKELDGLAKLHKEVIDNVKHARELEMISLLDSDKKIQAAYEDEIAKDAKEIIAAVRAELEYDKRTYINAPSDSHVWTYTLPNSRLKDTLPDPLDYIPEGITAPNIPGSRKKTFGEIFSWIEKHPGLHHPDNKKAFQELKEFFDQYQKEIDERLKLIEKEMAVAAQKRIEAELVEEKLIDAENAEFLRQYGIENMDYDKYLIKKTADGGYIMIDNERTKKDKQNKKSKENLAELHKQFRNDVKNQHNKRTDQLFDKLLNQKKEPESESDSELEKIRKYLKSVGFKPIMTIDELEDSGEVIKSYLEKTYPQRFNNDWEKLSSALLPQIDGIADDANQQLLDMDNIHKTIRELTIEDFNPMNQIAEAIMNSQNPSASNAQVTEVKSDLEAKIPKSSIQQAANDFITYDSNTIKPRLKDQASIMNYARPRYKQAHLGNKSFHVFEDTKNPKEIIKSGYAYRGQDDYSWGLAFAEVWTDEDMERNKHDKKYQWGGNAPYLKYEGDIIQNKWGGKLYLPKNIIKAGQKGYLYEPNPELGRQYSKESVFTVEVKDEKLWQFLTKWHKELPEIYDKYNDSAISAIIPSQHWVEFKNALNNWKHSHISLPLEVPGPNKSMPDAVVYPIKDMISAVDKLLTIHEELDKIKEGFKNTSSWSVVKSSQKLFNPNEREYVVIFTKDDTTGVLGRLPMNTKTKLNDWNVLRLNEYEFNEIIKANIQYTLGEQVLIDEEIPLGNIREILETLNIDTSQLDDLSKFNEAWDDYQRLRAELDQNSKDYYLQEMNKAIKKANRRVLSSMALGALLAYVGISVLPDSATGFLVDIVPEGILGQTLLVAEAIATGTAVNLAHNIIDPIKVSTKAIEDKNKELESKLQKIIEKLDK